YQEYKKIKALNEKNNSKTAEDDKDNSEGLTDLEAFYKDLDSYNNFISDFRVIYDNYSGLLIELFDSFNNEQEDLDKKNQYAESIIAYMKEWLDEIKVIDTPDIMTAYHNYFQKYLENEILSYESFINGDAELSEKYQSEADDMYKNTEEELQGIRENFISKALELGIEQPFDQ
ncbi:MAG: hypothetical protein JW997_04925, partial [Actinobacteria bacterium]|nr:hypothetical protein [Actinomycetota bacterium]